MLPIHSKFTSIAVLTATMFIFFSGCSSKMETIEFSSPPVPLEIKEYDPDPFSMNYQAMPLISKSKTGQVVEGFMVFPRNGNAARGSIFMIIDEEKRKKTGKWKIKECETNSTKISGKVETRPIGMNITKRWIRISPGKCLKIEVKHD